jgi:CRP-like cAMP-binding protein
MPACIDPQRLADMPLFDGLPAACLDRLAAALHSRSYPAGASILLAEQPSEAVYFVLSGRVRVFIEQADGSEVTFAFLGPGEVLGEMSAVDRAARCASAATVEPSVLLWLDRPLFQQCLCTEPTFTFNLVRQLTARLRQANEQIQALSSLDVAGRVAHQVLGLAEHYGEVDATGRVRIALPLTQRDLADMVGATRESVNRALSTLRQEGALEFDAGHRITVLDRACLERRRSPG